jgi:hypothetical protein
MQDILSTFFAFDQELTVKRCIILVESVSFVKIQNWWRGYSRTNRKAYIAKDGSWIATRNRTFSFLKMMKNHDGSTKKV